MGMPWVIVEQYDLLIAQEISHYGCGRSIIARMNSISRSFVALTVPLAASFRDPFVACLDLNDLFF